MSFFNNNKNISGNFCRAIQALKIIIDQIVNKNSNENLILKNFLNYYENSFF